MLVEALTGWHRNRRPWRVGARAGRRRRSGCCRQWVGRRWRDRGSCRLNGRRPRGWDRCRRDVAGWRGCGWRAYRWRSLWGRGRRLRRPGRDGGRRATGGGPHRREGRQRQGRAGKRRPGARLGHRVDRGRTGRRRGVLLARRRRRWAEVVAGCAYRRVVLPQCGGPGGGDAGVVAAGLVPVAEFLRHLGEFEGEREHQRVGVLPAPLARREGLLQHPAGGERVVPLPVQPCQQVRGV